MLSNSRKSLFLKGKKLSAYNWINLENNSILITFAASESESLYELFSKTIKKELIAPSKNFGCVALIS